MKPGRALRVALAWLATAAPAGAAEPGPHVELGLRLEWLRVHEPLDFSCDPPCDPATDTECEPVPVDALCEPVTLETPHGGWLLGGSVGAIWLGSFLGAGVRLGGAVGPFSPDPGARGGPTRSAESGGSTFAHVTLEVPMELRTPTQGWQLFARAVPRVGSLNVVRGKAEEADTFTAGIVLLAGLRIEVGGPGWAGEGGWIRHQGLSGVWTGAHLLIPARDEGPGPELPPDEDAEGGAAPPGWEPLDGGAQLLAPRTGRVIFRAPP